MDTVYATPRHVTSLDDCYYYHTMDLPGLGTTSGNWDLRAVLDSYLGFVPVDGKRVLDVGCASGMLSMHLEKLGAEVVSFDLDKHGTWDMVPWASWLQREHVERERTEIIDRLNNSYWLSHRLNQSKNRVVYGSVYDIPTAIGPVDIAVYGSILLHLRDPFRALESGLRLVRERVIVVEPMRGLTAGDGTMTFLPNPATEEPKDTWWDIPSSAAARMVGVLGFAVERVVTFSAPYDGVANELYALVAKRDHGTALEA